MDCLAQPKGERHEGHRTGRIRCSAARVRRFRCPPQRDDDRLRRSLPRRPGRSGLQRVLWTLLADPGTALCPALFRRPQLLPRPGLQLLRWPRLLRSRIRLLRRTEVQHSRLVGNSPPGNWLATLALAWVRQRRELVAATVKAIAAGSQQSTIKSISHRTAASGAAPTIIARYWIGPADASTRKRSPTSVARCACNPTRVAVAACRCVSNPSRVTRCCVAMLRALVTRPRRVDSSTARSICATRLSRSATAADCAVTRASSASVRSATLERAEAATLTCASTSLPNTPAALMSARPATRATMTERIFHPTRRQCAASHPATTSLPASIVAASTMTATGAPGNISVMPVTEKYAATVASARAATRAKAPLARSGVAGTASGTVGAAETVSGALGASCLPLAFVAFVRLGAGRDRLRFVAGKGALPDGSTLMFSTFVATNLGVRFEALAKPSNWWPLRAGLPSRSVSSVAEVPCVVGLPVMRHPAW